LYVGGDAEEGEDEGGVFEFVGEEMKEEKDGEGGHFRWNWSWN
jgi:hypothetical protein